MTETSTATMFQELPGPALIALAVALVVYPASLLEPWQPPVALTGFALGGVSAVLLLYGVHSRQQGQSQIAAALLPFGLFWLSLISYEVFPALGLGRHPDALTMFSYLSLWAMFSAILFLGSFRRSVALQGLYGTLMCALLALSMDHLRGDQVFLWLGCGFAFLAAVIALYMALAQCLNNRCRREVLRLGHWDPEDDVSTDENLV